MANIHKLFALEFGIITSNSRLSRILRLQKVIKVESGIIRIIIPEFSTVGVKALLQFLRIKKVTKEFGCRMFCLKISHKI